MCFITLPTKGRLIWTRSLMQTRDRYMHYLPCRCACRYQGQLSLTRLCRVGSQAVIHQIREFGQTPSQLFKAPHPQRKPRLSHRPQLSSPSSFGHSGMGGDMVSPQLTDPASTRSRSVSHTFSEDMDFGHEDLDEPWHTRTATRSIDMSGWKTTARRSVPSAFKRHAVPEAFAPLRRVQWGNGQARGVHVNSLGTITFVHSQDREKEKVHALPVETMLLPPRHGIVLSWGFLDVSIRAHAVTTGESTSSDARNWVRVSMLHHAHTVCRKSLVKHNVCSGCVFLHGTEGVNQLALEDFVCGCLHPRWHLASDWYVWTLTLHSFEITCCLRALP